MLCISAPIKKPCSRVSLSAEALVLDGVLDAELVFPKHSSSQIKVKWISLISLKYDIIIKIYKISSTIRATEWFHPPLPLSIYLSFLNSSALKKIRDSRRLYRPPSLNPIFANLRELGSSMLKARVSTQNIFAPFIISSLSTLALSLFIAESRNKRFCAGRRDKPSLGLY